MPPFRILSNGVAWQPWSRAAFARARTDRKPVLLSISATWCHWCHEMDRTSYGDPMIATFINERFVPIRVDADDRPDISERYNLGGWPTTAFLTPDGDILAGGTFVPIDRMPGVLARVADAFASRVDAPAHDVPEETFESPGDALDLDDLTSRVLASFDETFGGFGIEPKFPHTAPLQLALALFVETKDPASETLLVATLDAMGWSALFDEVDGGFFRYATTRDWQAPHFEKLLDVNAALTRIYLDAGTALQVARFTERAADTLRYIQTWLADPVDGGWHGSQQADEEYYTVVSLETRRGMTPPPVTRSFHTDSNAAMVSAALHAARVFNDEGLREFAVKSLERILLTCYKPGAGVAHHLDGQARVRGLLADQFAMATACLDVFDSTENVVYEMMAEELGHYAIRAMWDEERGGFFDRAQDDSEPPIGLMKRRLKPFVTNCDASRTLRRLAAASGDNDFLLIADRTVASMAPRAADQGPLAAHYVLAMRAAGAR